MWWVYGVTSPAIGPLALRGIAGERLTALRAGGVAAVVGEMRRAPRPTEANLRAYDRVIRRLTSRAAAVMPARFGARVENLGELSTTLAARGASLRPTLRALRHRVQMTTRVVTAHAAPVLAAPARSGAEYLRARAAAHHAPELDRIRPAVARWVRGERTERRGAVATMYHLIPRGAAPAYRRAVEREARGANVRAIVSGPWPAYAFADEW